MNSLALHSDIQSDAAKPNVSVQQGKPGPRGHSGKDGQKGNKASKYSDERLS